MKIFMVIVMKNATNYDLTAKSTLGLNPNTVMINPHKISANSKWYEIKRKIILKYNKDENLKDSPYYIVDNEYGIVAVGENLKDLMIDVQYYLYWFCCELYDKYESHEIKHVEGDPKLNLYRLIKRCNDEPIYYIEQLDPESRY